MAKVIKNTTNADIFIAEAGNNIPALGQIIIDPSRYYLWAKPEMTAEIAANVAAGYIVINDGTIDLDAVTGLRLLDMSARITVTLNSSSVKRVATDVDVQGDALVTDGGNGKINLIIGQTNTAIGKLYTIEATSNGTTQDKWLMVQHPSNPSDTTPFVVPGGIKAISITYSNANDSSECDVEIYKNASKIYTWQIRNKRTAWLIVNAGLFTASQGDRLSVYIKGVSGTSAKDPLVRMISMITSFNDANTGIENGV